MKMRLIEATGMIMLFLAVVAPGIDGICWNCMPKNLSEEEIDRILAEEFKDRVMEKLGLTSEPVVTENVTYPPQEVIDEIFSEENDVIREREENGVLQTIFIQPLNGNNLTDSNKASFFEYMTDTDDLNNYRVEHVTLWLRVNANAGSFRVYEKMSTLPRRKIFMEEYHGRVSEWKKLNFIPNRQWLQNPERKIRIEIEGMETPIVDKPLLQLKLQRVEKRLKKRSSTTPTISWHLTKTSDCHPKKVGYCCKHVRYIPIHKYYKWLLVPQTFKSFTCSGSCHPKYRNNNTWSLISQMTAPSRAPCCVPTGFKTMTLIFLEKSATNPDGKFITRSIDDLLVETCGCL